MGIHRLYTELAFINHYVSDTSYEFISTNTLYVLFRFIFTAILGGWYIKILILWVKKWRHREMKKLYHDPSAFEYGS